MSYWNCDDEDIIKEAKEEKAREFEECCRDRILDDIKWDILKGYHMIDVATKLERLIHEKEVNLYPYHFQHSSASFRQDILEFLSEHPEFVSELAEEILENKG